MTKTGTYVDSVTFPDGHSITVGQEATVGCGDHYPAKVESIQRVKGGYEVLFRRYMYRATEAGKALGMGHQDWEILWDQPSGATEMRVHKDGRLYNSESGYHYTIGVASVYYVWEF